MHTRKEPGRSREGLLKRQCEVAEELTEKGRAARVRQEASYICRRELSSLLSLSLLDFKPKFDRSLQSRNRQSTFAVFIPVHLGSEQEKRIGCDGEGTPVVLESCWR